MFLRPRVSTRMFGGILESLGQLGSQIDGVDFKVRDAPLLVCRRQLEGHQALSQITSRT